MTFARLVETHPVVLSECAISERLRRMSDIELHPTLFNSPLIYSEVGRQRLAEIYQSYIRVAQESRLPLLLCAPTWRLDKTRVEEAGVAQTINRDAVSFMETLKDSRWKSSSPISVGALLAPRNDCYSPVQSLSREQSAEVHAWQIEQLAESPAEVIISQTMPAVSESLGMAARCGESGKDYIISFVIDREGKVLDSTPLAEAIDSIDQEIPTPPLGYMVNCVYPTFIKAEEQSPQLFKRLLGIQANASSKDHDELDGAEDLLQDPLPDWTAHMVRLNQEFGIKILGGCCGTDDNYLHSLAQSL